MAPFVAQPSLHLDLVVHGSSLHSKHELGLFFWTLFPDRFKVSYLACLAHDQGLPRSPSHILSDACPIDCPPVCGGWFCSSEKTASRVVMSDPLCHSSLLKRLIWIGCYPFGELLKAEGYATITAQHEQSLQSKCVF